MKFKRIIFGLLTILALYLISYCILSALGGYRYDQSGRIRYGLGFSASDLELWHPKYAWFQGDFVNIEGKKTTRGDLLGYFYSPLISLDRLVVHKTVPIEEL